MKDNFGEKGDTRIENNPSGNGIFMPRGKPIRRSNATGATARIPPKTKILAMALAVVRTGRSGLRPRFSRNLEIGSPTRAAITVIGSRERSPITGWLSDVPNTSRPTAQTIAMVAAMKYANFCVTADVERLMFGIVPATALLGPDMNQFGGLRMREQKKQGEVLKGSPKRTHSEYGFYPTRKHIFWRTGF